MIKTALFLLILCFLTPTPAQALEALRFKAAETYKEKQIIDFVQKSNGRASGAYALAPADLNNDAINEYVVRPAAKNACADAPLCSYQIIAFQDHKPIMIGQFDAHKMLVSDKKAYGIRHIIVYNEPHNDFNYETAVWNPFSFRFELP